MIPKQSPGRIRHPRDRAATPESLSPRIPIYFLMLMVAATFFAAGRSRARAGTITPARVGAAATLASKASNAADASEDAWTVAARLRQPKPAIKRVATATFVVPKRTTPGAYSPVVAPERQARIKTLMNQIANEPSSPSSLAAMAELQRELSGAGF